MTITPVAQAEPSTDKRSPRCACSQCRSRIAVERALDRALSQKNGCGAGIQCAGCAIIGMRGRWTMRWGAGTAAVMARSAQAMDHHPAFGPLCRKGARVLARSAAER